MGEPGPKVSLHDSPKHVLKAMKHIKSRSLLKLFIMNNLDYGV